MHIINALNDIQTPQFIVKQRLPSVEYSSSSIFSMTDSSQKQLLFQKESSFSICLGNTSFTMYIYVYKLYVKLWIEIKGTPTPIPCPVESRKNNLFQSRMIFRFDHEMILCVTAGDESNQVQQVQHNGWQCTLSKCLFLHWRLFCKENILRLLIDPNSLDNKGSWRILKDFYCSVTMLRELGLISLHQKRVNSIDLSMTMANNVEWIEYISNVEWQWSILMSSLKNVCCGNVYTNVELLYDEFPRYLKWNVFFFFLSFSSECS